MEKYVGGLGGRAQRLHPIEHTNYGQLRRVVENCKDVVVVGRYESVPRI